MCIQSTYKPLTRNLIFKHSKAKFMKKLTVKLGLLFALTAILFTACQKDALVNNAVENIQTESSENIELREVVTDCGITVSTSGLTITLTDNSYAPQFTIVTVTTQNWSYAELLCNDHTGGFCTPGSSNLTVPNPGQYFVHVQSGSVNCSFSLDITVCPIDNDSDGVCSTDDCDDNDASVGEAQEPGTACDDGNPDTCNDVIQADECTCMGDECTECPLVISQCDIVVCVSGQTITLLESNSPASPPFTIVTVTTPNWSFAELLCNDHTGDDCEFGKSVTVPSSGTYVIHVQSGGGNCTIDVQI